MPAHKNLMNDAPLSKDLSVPIAQIGTTFKKLAISLTGAFNHKGIFEKCIFVSDCYPSDRLDGDARLTVDLGAKLAKAMNITPRYVRAFDIDAADPKYRKVLFITMNCDIPQEKLPKRSSCISLAISNDYFGYASSAKSDFRFEPNFTLHQYDHPPGQRSFKIDTLPTRVSSETIEDAALKNTEIKSDGKPLVVIMIRKQNTAQMQRLLTIAKSLAVRHAARFALCMGPMSCGDAMNHMESDVWDSHIPGILKYRWPEKPNPYLAILGAATHFVTSGTLSTTSDLLATGKPVYYMHDDVSMDDEGRTQNNCNGRLRQKLFDDKTVQDFSESILDIPPPNQSIRTYYAQEWDRVGAEFVETLAPLLKDFQLPSRLGRKLFSLSPI